MLKNIIKSRNILREEVSVKQIRGAFTTTAVTFKIGAIKALANDNTGKHAHVIKSCCTMKDCENKKSQTSCGPVTKNKLLGHNTHKPKIDVEGNPKAQYFVKNNKKNYCTKKLQTHKADIKSDPKTTSYVNKYHDKYNYKN